MPEQESEQQDVKNADQPQGDNLNQPQGDKTVPYHRFKEINDKYKELDAWKRERETAERQAKEAEMLEQKRFQELLQARDSELETLKKERDQLATKAQSFEQQEKKIREEALKRITDPDVKKLAEKLPEVSDVVAFVEKFESSKGSPFQGKPSSAGVDNNPLKPTKGESYQQWEARVRSSGKTPK